MLTTCERRKSEPLHPHIEDFYRFWDSFCDREWVRLFFIDYMQEPVCAAFSFSFGHFLFMYQFGWSGKHGHLQPSKLLFWKTIEWAKNKGFRYYDFVSVDTEVSKAVEAGLPIDEELQKRSFYGPTHLKLSFGGTISHLPGAFAYFPNVFLRIFSNTILRPILKQDWFFRLTNSFWARQKRNLPVTHTSYRR
jgi:lipid II:glycine glycyltransferase (peptidoglycan interpeptide bridge formation enzyme)